MEEHQEHKFECKFCNERFSSRKSLSFHMKIHDHESMDSAETEEKFNTNKMGFEIGEPSSYELRENPKKSSRFSDSKNGGLKKEETHCIVCDKGFPTLRALSGHMRHHSKKVRGKHYCKDCGKEFGSSKALFGHMRTHSDLYKVHNHDGDDHHLQSEEGTSSFTKRKRSKRYGKMISTANANSSFVSDSNVSLIVDDIEIEAEVKEVAASLIMLSRDVRIWGRIDLIGETSRCSNQDEAIAENGGGSLGCNGDQSLKMIKMHIEEKKKKEKKKKEKKKLDDGDVMLLKKVVSEFSDLGDGVVSTEVKKVLLEVPINGFFNGGVVLLKKVLSEFADLGDGIMSTEAGKVEWEVPIDGFFNGDELKKLSFENKAAETELSDTEMAKGFVDEVEELGKAFSNENGSDRASVSESRKKPYCSRKKARLDAYDPESGGVGGSSCRKMISTSDECKSLDDSCTKGTEYKCRTCEKVFKSHQALGGHRARHHKSAKNSSVVKIKSCQKGIHASSLLPDPDDVVEPNSKLGKLESCSNSEDHDEVGGTSMTICELKKRCKEHECLICFKTFSSGQALGGHMRAHFAAGNTEIVIKQTIVTDEQEQHSDIHDVFDLDLSAAATTDLENDGNVDLSLKPWWVGNNHKNEEHQLLVGIVSNSCRY